MGLGAAMIFPATLSLITNVFTERGERARAIGLWGATAGAAIALGPIAGGWLLEHFSWNSIFVAMVPVAALGAAFVAWVRTDLARSTGGSRQIPAGLVLSTAAMALLIYTIIEAPNYGWGSTRSLARLRRFRRDLLGAFVAWEHRSQAPMLDVRFFFNRRSLLGRPPVGDDHPLHLLRLLRVHVPPHPVLPVHPRLQPAQSRGLHHSLLHRGRLDLSGLSGSAPGS